MNSAMHPGSGINFVAVAQALHMSLGDGGAVQLRAPPCCTERESLGSAPWVR